MFHTAPDGCHCTCTEMSSCAVSYRPPFDVNLLCRKEEAKKGGGGAGGEGSCGGLGGLTTHEELDVAQVERGRYVVGPAGAVFPGSKEEEESDLGEVCDSLVSWGGTFGDSVHAVEDGHGEGANSSRGRIFFRVGRKLSSQAKFDVAHAVESRVRGTHGRKDLSHGADVLFHASLLDGLVVGRQDACAELVSKDL